MIALLVQLRIFRKSDTLLILPEPRSQSEAGKDRDRPKDPKVISGSYQAKYLSQNLAVRNIGLQHVMVELRSGSSLQILSLLNADSSKYQISCLTPVIAPIKQKGD